MGSLELQGSTATLGLIVVGFKDPWEPEGDRQSFQQHPGETLESSMSPWYGMYGKTGAVTSSLLRGQNALLFMFLVNSAHLLSF